MHKRAHGHEKRSGLDGRTGFSFSFPTLSHVQHILFFLTVCLFISLSDANAATDNNNTASKHRRKRQAGESLL